MSDEVKIYKDAYADPGTCILMYKCKTDQKSGVFYCPNVKPNVFVRIIRIITKPFRKPAKTELL